MLLGESEDLLLEYATWHCPAGLKLGGLWDTATQPLEQGAYVHTVQLCMNVGLH